MPFTPDLSALQAAFAPRQPHRFRVTSTVILVGVSSTWFVRWGNLAEGPPPVMPVEVVAGRSGGAVLWSLDARSSVFSAPAIVATMMIVDDTRGDLIAFVPG